MRLVTVPGVFVNEMVPVCELPFNVAVMMAVWFDVKLPAVALKVAEMAPAATVTDAGTVTTAVLLLRPTAAPPFGAAWVKVTVQVVVLPEPSVPGVHVTEITPAPARTERDELSMPFKVAVTFAVWPAAVADAVAENVPLVVPAAMVTCAGTVTDGLSLATATMAPPAGAAPDKVMVHVAAAPAGTKGGAQLNEISPDCPPPPPPPPPVDGADRETIAACDVPE